MQKAQQAAEVYGCVRPLVRPCIKSFEQVIERGNLVFQSDYLRSSTLDDTSDNNLDATMYTGRGVTLDGTNDLLIRTGLTITDTITITGWAKSTTPTTIYAIADGNDPVNGSAAIIADGTWQQFTITLATTDADRIYLGYDGNNGYFAGSLADISILEGLNALGDYYFNEYTDETGDGLNGMTFYDRSGNGNHLTAQGCSAEIQQGVPYHLSQLGAEYDDQIWFDGVDDYVQLASSITVQSENEKVSISFIITAEGTTSYLIGASTATVNTIHYNSTTDKFATYSNSGEFANTDVAGVKIGQLHTLTVERDGAGNSIFKLDGSTIGTIANVGYVWNRIGARANAYTGEKLYTDVTFYNSSGVAIHQYDGTGDPTWTDLIGSNNGTVNGSPAVVLGMKYTIVQTAALNWNFAQNLFKNSEDATAWSVLNGGTGLAPVRTANFAVAPDGSSTADRVQLDQGAGTASTDYSLIIADQNRAGLSSAYRTGSIWMKSNTGSDQVILMYNSGNGVGKEVTVTSTWQRFELAESSYSTSSFVASTTLNLIIGIRGGAGAKYFNGTNTPQTADILVWGAQANEGSSAFPYIQTSTTYGFDKLGIAPEDDTNLGYDVNGNAISNPRDTARDVNLAGADYGLIPYSSAWDNITTAATWAAVVDATTLDNAEQDFLGRWETGGFKCWNIQTTAANPDRIAIQIGNGSGAFLESAALDSFLTTGRHHYAITVEPSGGFLLFRFYRDGTQVGTDTTSTATTIPALGTNPIAIGTSLVQSTPEHFAKMMISSVQVWSATLNATQISQLSAYHGF